jgi:hypothetical protein
MQMPGGGNISKGFWITIGVLAAALVVSLIVKKL